MMWTKFRETSVTSEFDKSDNKILTLENEGDREPGRCWFAIIANAGGLPRLNSLGLLRPRDSSFKCQRGVPRGCFDKGR